MLTILLSAAYGHSYKFLTVKLARKIIFYSLLLSGLSALSQRQSEYYLGDFSNGSQTKFGSFYGAINNDVLFSYQQYNLAPPISLVAVPVYLKANGQIDTVAYYSALQGAPNQSTIQVLEKNIFLDFSSGDFYQYNQLLQRVDFGGAALGPNQDIYFRSLPFYRDSVVYYITGKEQFNQPLASDTSWLQRIDLRQSPFKVDTVQYLLHAARTGSFTFNYRTTDSTLWVRGNANWSAGVFGYKKHQAIAQNILNTFSFAPSVLRTRNYLETVLTQNGYWLKNKAVQGQTLDSNFIAFRDTLIDETYLSANFAPNGYVVLLSEAYLNNGDTLIRGRLHFLNNQLQYTRGAAVVSYTRNFFPRSTIADPISHSFLIGGDSFDELYHRNTKSYNNLDLQATVVLVDSNGLNPRSIKLAEPPKESLGFYPNPVQNVLKIIGEKTPYDYKIYSLSGIMLQQGQSNFAGQIDLSALTKGTYLLVLELGEGHGKSTLRLLKN
jgi:hypothetical protein